MEVTDPVGSLVGRDRAQVLMRLGWAIAELRGRVYFRPADPGCIVGKAAPRIQHSLPLYFERSPKELLIETKQVVQELARQAGLELDGNGMKDSCGATAAQCTAAARVCELASKVSEGQSESWRASWNAFTLALYQWDAAIQDRLASASFGESSAYQLGRGLAECSWALDPRRGPNHVMGWEHVLGSVRCVALTRLLERLVPVVPAETVSAIKGSLAAWQRVARDRHWREDTTPPASVYLRRQVDVWRDLIIGGTDPRVFARPPATVQHVANIFPIIRGLRVQLVTGLLSVCVLGAGVWSITEYGNSKLWAALVSALGIFGITTASLLASVKKKATGLVESVRSAIAADEIAKAATMIPDRPKGTTVKGPGKLSTPGSFAEPITLRKIDETPLAPDAAA